MILSIFLSILSCLVVFSQATEKTVATSRALQSILKSASPGDIINMASGMYPGPFVIIANGTKAAPIVLQTTDHSVKIAGTGTSRVGLTILGNYWTIKYIAISNFDTGLLLKGSGIILESLAVTDVSTGVDVQGKRNRILNCAVEASKVGVHVKADNATLQSNSVTPTGSSDLAILADKDTCCGVLEWNAVSGNIKVHGKKYRMDENVILEVEGRSFRKGEDGQMKEAPVPTSFWSSIANFFRSLR